MTLKAISTFCREFGFDLDRIMSTPSRLKGLAKFVRDLAAFKKAAPSSAIESLYFCLSDYQREAGTAKGPYFHQDLLVAQRIFKAQPIKHLDIASRIDGFVAHVASFREITVADVRTLSSQSENIEFVQLDITNPESTAQLKNRFDSISCLHALEHFGLGRYGDSIDPSGHLRALENIKTILQPGGVLYLSFPIGRPRIEFNAHRIFALEHAIDLIKTHGFHILDFSYVDDGGNLHRDVDFSSAAASAAFNCNHGCGIFTLTI